MKRRKSDSITILKKRLWKIFSLYVKLRDNWTCCTCGRQARGAAMSTGHYIARAACGNKYYFSERNNHAQCANCNLRLEGNRPAYRAFILRTYGAATLRDLEENYWKPSKWTAEDFKEKIASYETKVAELSTRAPVLNLLNGSYD